MPPPGSLRRFIAAAALLRPRVISRVSQRAEQAHGDVRKLRDTVTQLTDRVDALASQLADASVTIKDQRRHIEMLTELHRHDADHRHAIASSTADLRGDDVREHVLRRIATACVDDDPFPHAVVDDILPSNVYKHLIQALPPPVFFDERPVHKAQFLRMPFATAPAYSRHVWHSISDVLDEALPQSLLERFRPHIDAYLGSFSPALQGQPLRFKVMDSRILLRRPGYAINPHRDPRWGFLTMLVYLVRRGETSEYGTQLYRLGSEEQPRTTGEVYYVDGERCELARDVPSRANAALIFLNSHGAHGASIPHDAPAGTERYVYQVRLGPDPDSARRLVAAMPEAARRHWAMYRGKDIAGSTALPDVV